MNIIKEINIIDKMISTKFNFIYYKENDEVEILDTNLNVRFRFPYKTLIEQMEKAKELRKTKYGLED